MDTAVNFSRQKLSSIFKTLTHAESAQKNFSYKGARISLVSIKAGHTDFVEWTFGEIIFCVTGEAGIKFPTRELIDLKPDQFVKIASHERKAVIEAKTDTMVLVLEIKPERDKFSISNPWKM